MKWKVFFWVVMLSFPALSQDNHFSMFSFATASLNPGMTGVFEHDHQEADFRIFANHRNQWRSIRSPYASGPTPFSTYSVSSDFRLRWLRLLRYNTIGFGFMAFKDKAGDLDFGTTQFAWSLSFQKVMGKSRRDYLTLGVQNGTVRRSVDFASASFDSQWSGTNYDPSTPSGEVLPTPQFYYQDINVGMSYTHRISQKNLKTTPWTIGIASFHLNQGNQSFSKNGADVLLKRKWMVHGSAKFSVKERHTIYPVFLLMKQGQASEANVTIYGGKKMSSDEVQVRLGIGYRMVNSYERKVRRDAALFALWVLYKEWDFGFSYDTNFSDLNKATNVRGGFEIFIIFHQQLDKHKSKYHRFRSRVPECPNVYDEKF